MGCNAPLSGWLDPTSRKFSTRRPAGAEERVTVPCGGCIGCRLDKSREWAVRMMHETQMHGESLFVTLTYDDDNLPRDWSLRPRDMTLFLKRLRKHVGTDNTIRYYQCGEYGDRTKRPHHHAIIWGWRPSDTKVHSGSGRHRLYTSAELEALWGHGQTPFGDVTFESCAYVARYVTKKIGGDMADLHYRRFDDETGEVWNIRPEYATMSRRPGIGFEWFRQFGHYTFTHDHVIAQGKPMRVPRTYDNWLKREDFETFEQIKNDRCLAPRVVRTDRQLRAREIIAKKRLQQRDEQK